MQFLFTIINIYVSETRKALNGCIEIKVRTLLMRAEALNSSKSILTETVIEYDVKFIQLLPSDLQWVQGSAVSLYICMMVIVNDHRVCTMSEIFLGYRSFHKTLPRSSAFVNRISVRFYETACMYYKAKWEDVISYNWLAYPIQRTNWIH